MHRFAYSRLLWHVLWRYQLTSAILDRLAVNEVVLEGPALLLLLRDRTRRPLPATVHLASVKGSVDLGRQRQGTLRSLLRQPNRVLSLVHVPDEPADLVRELPLLLDGAARPPAWADLVRGALSQDGNRANVRVVERSLDEWHVLGRPRPKDEVLLYGQCRLCPVSQGFRLQDGLPKRRHGRTLTVLRCAPRRTPDRKPIVIRDIRQRLLRAALTGYPVRSGGRGQCSPACRRRRGHSSRGPAVSVPLRLVRQGDDRVLVIGADTAGRLLEVVVLDPDGDPVAIHAMPLRQKFYRYL